MFQKSDEALHSLSLGEFEKAKSVYSVLLDKDPEDLEYISGYFVASFWDNRLDLVLRTREGRDRGNLLLEYFSLFEEESKKRNLDTTEPYHTCMRCVLEEAAQHLKLAYQWEGANALDSETLGDLAVCLIKIGDYKTALEIIQYSSGRNRFSPNLKFFLAESYCMTGKEKEGIETYRSAFLDDPNQFRMDLVSWPPLLSLIEEAKTLVKTEDELKEILPVLAWKSGLFATGKRESIEDIKSWQKEIARLSESAKKGSGYSFKIKCRIEQYAYFIIETAPQAIARDAVLFAQKILEEI
ncbi:hypothetical protein LPTSP3_g22980 [Leptospira kobayashii]|uniref:Tetratricopeptide repeat protein n=1 Tax=Leptospira kobayashii TaxID=1917830 RepID=A0ABM7URZ5_9LEPT|nr:hypothetical protein [Leptospira kobayashii]BDA79368.1 hypothetical protein LPTSP3_g22980 [Leptospira kobayashii]